MEVPLEEVLAACLSQDNQVRKRAEEYLKERMQHVEVFPQLVDKLRSAADPQVRQLAAVLLRKRVGKQWVQLPQEVQQGIKQVLLQRIVDESVGTVRRGVAEVVGVIAQQAVPKQQWPELLQFLYQCTQSSDAGHREVALTLFSSLAFAIGEQLAPHAVALMAVMSSGLGDPHPDVVAAALQAVEPLLPMVNSQQEVAAFHQLLGALLQLAEKLLGSREEDLLLLVCQVLGEVSEVAAPLLQPALLPVVQLAAGIGTNRQLQNDTRAQALEVLHLIVRNKPKQVVRTRVVGGLVEALCVMACEDMVANSGEDEEQLGLPPHTLACQLLDDMALNLRSKEVFPKVVAFMQQTAASPDPNQRGGCMNVLAAVCEGCCDAFRSRLREMLAPVVAAMQDQELQVCAAATFTLAQYSQFLQPEMAGEHETVLPLVLRALQQPNKTLQERSFCALDAFCENMGPEIGGYVEQLMGGIMAVLAGANRELQEMALSALASMLTAASQPFMPFAGTLLPLLENFMQVSSPDSLDLRCRATECAGFVVDIVTPDALPAVADRFVELGLKGFPLGYPTLREFTHDMFGQIAKTLGAGFSKYMQYVVPLALESCRQEDGTFYDSADEEEERDTAAAQQQPLVGGRRLEDISDDSDEDEDDHDPRLSVRTGLTDEKVAATQSLGLYATSNPAAFAPYLEEALSVLKAMSIYFHAEVRAQAYESLSRLVAGSHTIWPPVPPAPASPQVQQLLQAIMGVLLHAVVDDDDKIAAAAAVSALFSLLKAVGAAALGPWMERVMEAVKKLMTFHTACQREEDEDDGLDVEDDEGDDEAEELFATVCEAFPIMAEALGVEGYAPVFSAHHFPLLQQHLKPQGTSNAWRAAVTGCLAEVTQKLEGHMGPHVEKLVPVLLRETRVDDSMNRQNAAFCLGVLVQACPSQCQPFFAQILQVLHSLCARVDEVAGVRDNAVGAVGRMLLAAAPALPVEQILPAWLGVLPIREDMSEVVPTYNALCHLLTTDHHAHRVAPFLPQIFHVLGAVLVQPRTEAVRGSVALVVSQLQQQHANQVGALLQGWSSEQHAALAAALACQPQPN